MIINPNAVLKNTSLCAMVKDEEQNCAHGAEKWLRSTLPYVEKAVVVDTGSTDGTLEILRRLKREFPYLDIYERRMDDFASSRNFSLTKVKTPRALILDADELLMPEEYARLQRFVEANPAKGYDFTFKQIRADGAIFDTMAEVQILRLFDPSIVKFENHQSSHYEDPEVDEERRKFLNVPDSTAIIKHFRPDLQAVMEKIEVWYGKRQYLEERNKIGELPIWKQPNGARNFYLGTEEQARAINPELVSS